MPDYELPTLAPRPALVPQTAWLIASGDLRPLANAAGWPSQEQLEHGVATAFSKIGWTVHRAHDFDPVKGHGFIDSQRAGLRVFEGIPPEAPLIVAEGVWQYSHHVLAGLRTHRGPVLTVANFDGKWPGLVGLLGLNAGMTKMGREYSTIWSTDFTDEWFLSGIEEWAQTGRITHDQSHVSSFTPAGSGPEAELAAAVAAKLLTDKAIIGVFDEGCMGMYNAVFDDELLNGLGIYKERLSQSALYAEMLRVPDTEADGVRRWLEERGMRFQFGTDPDTELTEEQVRQQCKMYIASLRISDDFGLDAVGIQYQQGLKDLVAASDLAEGLLNNADRPPVTSRDGTRVLWDGAPLVNFNEVDEGVAADALVTNRVWTAMGMDPATTLHDVRWGEEYDGQFVWVFEISGSVPPSHFEHGYAEAVSMRQNPVYFPAGGGTIRGVSKPGEIVWSRLYISGGRLHLDIGRGQAVRLPGEETERRWNATSPEWPMMHAVLYGVTRDQFMARHKANHVQVAYAPDADAADRAFEVKAAVFAGLGVIVHQCGTTTAS
jgi:L-fucose isomerase, C-terminal domain